MLNQGKARGGDLPGCRVIKSLVALSATPDKAAEKTAQIDHIRQIITPIYPILPITARERKLRIHCKLFISPKNRNQGGQAVAAYQSLRLGTLRDLRGFVKQTLCDSNYLQEDQFPMAERVLLRGGRPQGVLFWISGPRQVRLTAIWDADRRQVLFYDSAGERYLTVPLAEAPVLPADCDEAA